MSDEPFQETLSVFVADDVAPADKMGGSPPPKTEKEGLRELAIKYLGRYVQPHNKVSREVTQEDVQTVIEEGKIMINLCRIPRGGATGAEAIAHMQIEDNDPLAFFVTQRGEVIINPEVIRSSDYMVDKEEGCMSFPAEPPKKVFRYHKTDVKFQTLIKDEEGNPKLSEPKTLTLSGHVAQVFQHEMAHLLGWNIYDEDYINEACKTKRT